jgi:hypothetical protein
MGLPEFCNRVDNLNHSAWLLEWTTQQSNVVRRREAWNSRRKEGWLFFRRGKSTFFGWVEGKKHVAIWGRAIEYDCSAQLPTLLTTQSNKSAWQKVGLDGKGKAQWLHI